MIRAIVALAVAVASAATFVLARGHHPDRPPIVCISYGHTWWPAVVPAEQAAGLVQAGRGFYLEQRQVPGNEPCAVTR